MFVLQTLDMLDYTLLAAPGAKRAFIGNGECAVRKRAASGPVRANFAHKVHPESRKPPCKLTGPEPLIYCRSRHDYTEPGLTWYPWLCHYVYPYQVFHVNWITTEELRLRVECSNPPPPAPVAVTVCELRSDPSPPPSSRKNLGYMPLPISLSFIPPAVLWPNNVSTRSVISSNSSLKLYPSTVQLIAFLSISYSD